MVGARLVVAGVVVKDGVGVIAVGVYMTLHVLLSTMFLTRPRASKVLAYT